MKLIEDRKDKEESVVEILLKNLNPELACEIEECWIDPDSISIGHLLGKGNF